MTSNDFQQKIDSRKICLFVDPMECIKKGKLKHSTINLGTPFAAGDNDGTATCCETPGGTCGKGGTDDVWKKGHCWSIGREWKGGDINSSGLDCCKPFDGNKTCKDWDWQKCFTVVGRRGEYLKELAKIPDPQYGYADRDANPYLLCEKPAPGEDLKANCNKDTLSKFNYGLCKGDKTKCESIEACSKLSAAEQSSCITWDANWLVINKKLMEPITEGMDGCCNIYDDSAPIDIKTKCGGNLYVGDILDNTSTLEPAQKDDLLWGNINFFMGKGEGNTSEYRCNDTTFDPTNKTSCICKNCSSGSNYYNDYKDSKDFKVKQLENPECSLSRCYGKNCFSKVGEDESCEEIRWDDECAKDGTRSECKCGTEGKGPCLDRACKSECKPDFNCEGDKTLKQEKAEGDSTGCKPAPLGESDEDQRLAEILESMGMNQECKQKARTTTATASASMNATCPFGSVGGQMSASAMDNSMEQSGCGMLSATLTNLNNSQQAETCSKTSVSNETTIAVSANAKITIETLDPTDAQNALYREMMGMFLSAYIAETNPESKARIGDNMLSLSAKNDRSISITNSTLVAEANVDMVTKISNHTTLASNMASEFESMTAVKAENEMAVQLGVNALSPNTKQLINQKMKNSNKQMVTVLADIISNTGVTSDGNSGIVITAPGKINITGSTITANTTMNIVNQLMNETASSLGQAISASVISDVSSSLKADGKSAGLDDLQRALGATISDAINAGKVEMDYSWIMYLVGGAIALALIGVVAKSMMGGKGSSDEAMGDTIQDNASSAASSAISSYYKIWIYLGIGALLLFIITAVVLFFVFK